VSFRLAVQDCEYGQKDEVERFAYCEVY